MLARENPKTLSISMCLVNFEANLCEHVQKTFIKSWFVTLSGILSIIAQVFLLVELCF